jgi:glycerophosphoryl diester phosphodiesterase
MTRYLPDNQISGLPTRVLMHRGNGQNTDFIENTLPAAQFGLSILDGIEVDVQISKDGTLWLNHDNEVYDCHGNRIGCFQTLNDNEIMSISECDGIRRYYTLESIFRLMVSEYPNSFISLDIKGQYCQILKIRKTMHQMAESLLKLVAQYNMEGRVVAGSSSFEFLKKLKNQTAVIQCFVSLGDLEEGLENAASVKARGIYVKYGKEEINEDVVSLVHRKGFILGVWVVNEPDDIQAVWDAKPDFIETDNTGFKKNITSR